MEADEKRNVTNYDEYVTRPGDSVRLASSDHEVRAYPRMQAAGQVQMTNDESNYR